jgi:hypothetical protein
MKTCTHTLWSLAFCTLLASFSLAQSTQSDVAPVQKRLVTIELARKYTDIAPPLTVGSLGEMINPFSPSSYGKPAKTDDKNNGKFPSSDKEMLALLADQLNPTGTFFLNNEPLLLFGQKKVKVGERIPITLDGVIFEVEVTAIERINFTLKYKQQELTRPLK